MLLEMRAEDFCCFRKIRLKLDRQGLVWIGGENNDTDAADNNAAGKTTLFKALTWCLFGDVIDGERGDKVIRHGAKRAIVETDLEGEWTVRRERKKGAPKVSLLHKGKTVEMDKKGVQAKINELIGLDFKAFKNTVLYGQNDSARFADPRLRDAERKDMLHCILRTEVLKGCHVTALARAKSIKGEIGVIEHEMEKADMRHGDARAQRDRVIAKEAEWGALRESRVEEAKSEALGLKQQAQLAIDSAPDVSELEAEQERLQGEYEDAKEAKEMAEAFKATFHAWQLAVSDKRSEIVVLQSEVAKLSEQIKRLKGDKCPLCTGNLKAGRGHDHRAGLLKEREDLAVHESTLEYESDVLQKSCRHSSEKAEQLGKKANLAPIQSALFKNKLLIQQAEFTAERAKGLLNQARASIVRMKAILNEENPHAESVEAWSGKLKKYIRKVEMSKSSLKERSEELSQIDFWVRGFSGQGLPSFILDSVMPYITERANHYLEILADGDITMEFSTQRELKSDKDKYRDEIDIRWMAEGVENYPPSGGQLRKMEIATDLALMDLTETREGAGLNIFIADEILDGLDAEGTDRVLQLLHQLRSRRGTIFVISHQPSMGEIFEKSITVIKQDGESRLEYAA